MSLHAGNLTRDLHTNFVVRGIPFTFDDPGCLEARAICRYSKDVVSAVAGCRRDTYLPSKAGQKFGDYGFEQRRVELPQLFGVFTANPESLPSRPFWSLVYAELKVIISCF